MLEEVGKARRAFSPAASGSNFAVEAGPWGGSMDKGRALIGHYDKTFDVTWQLWGQRNKTFLLLLLVVGLANLLTNDEFLRILINAALGYLTGNKSTEVDFKDTIPYQTIQIAMLILVFYYMVTIYHRSATVLRNYAYLDKMEQEIRYALQITDERDVAFAREGGFYWAKRPFLFAGVKYFYIVIVLGLVGLYYYARVTRDFAKWDQVMLVADVLVGIPTAIVFLAYASQTLQLDRRRKGQPALVKPGKAAPLVTSQSNPSSQLQT
jgi:hypothetical protein